jgi:two-component SAPR family response regulator
MKYIIADPDGQNSQELVEMIDGVGSMQLIGSFTALESHIDIIRGHPPDLAFIRLGSPALNGFRLTGIVREVNPDAKVIFLATEEVYALDAFEEGADGFLMLPLDRGKVGSLIEQVRNKAIKPPNSKWQHLSTLI